MKLVYPAVFYPCECGEGYVVEFPDLSGCITQGESFEEAFKKAYKVKGPAVIDLTIKTDSVVLPMLKPGGTFNNLILRREDISDAEK